MLLECWKIVPITPRNILENSVVPEGSVLDSEICPNKNIYQPDQFSITAITNYNKSSGLNYTLLSSYSV